MLRSSGIIVRERLALTAAARQIVHRIVVTVQVGKDRLAGTDDPIFLGLRGPDGREFRLELEKGKSWRRGALDRFVLGGPGDPDTNVARPELNDPAAPPIDAARLAGAYLRKGQEPIPNVRGMGEMDDRIQLETVEIEVHAEGRAEPLRFARREPCWLGLVCGLHIEIPPAEGSA
jgi:hypothetical protein